MTRLISLTALAAALPIAALADFNDAGPNAPDQTPAFAGQTRAPVLDEGVTLQRETLVDGLDAPWGMAMLPDGSWLITERPGALRILSPDGTLSDPVAGVPAVDARGQGGLLDVAVAGDFDQTRQVWLSFAQPFEGGDNATAVATGILSADGTTLDDTRVIFTQTPAWESDMHYGSRLVFDRDGALFVTTGERSVADARVLAQDVSTHLGKIIRIDPQGGPAAGNPEIDGGLPEIWSYGHRNVQGAALDADGRLWTIEHGAAGGDELNRPEAGLNYGWPVVSYGVEYSGEPIGDGLTAQDGVEQPVYYWDPVIAPSNMVFYDGAMFPDWQGDVLIGGLGAQALVRLDMNGDSVAGEARYLEGENRIRDVAVAQDGAILVLTDDGTLDRLTPAQ